jgi:alpha-galactosidase
MTSSAELSTAYASFDKGSLVIGNALIERVWRWREGTLRATGFLHKSTHRQWFSSEEPSPSLTPARPSGLTTETPTFEARRVQDGPLEQHSLVATLTLPDRILRFKIFDLSPGVTLQLIDRAPASPNQNDKVDSAADGIEADAQTPQTASSDTIDCFRPTATHLRLIQATLVDRTDIHDNLVHENCFFLTVAERSVQLSGNLFYLEDTLTGDGIVSLKLAPLPHARPVVCKYDIQASFGDIRFLGHCVGATGLGYALVSLAYSGGRVGRIEAVQQYQRLFRPYRPGRDALFLSNTWGDRNQDSRVNESFILREIDTGASLGLT